MPGAWLRRKERGFTLTEILIVVAILVVLAAVAIPSYQRYVERARVMRATQDIGAIAAAIQQSTIDTNTLPNSLDEIRQARNDPWGRPYQYYNLQAKKGNGGARKDKKLAPLNSDFDLYSLGKDGLSKPQLNNKESRDDVVRARDGKYIGLAEDFDP